jgi:isoquinoline 1-oxidoreductase subunit alpha
MTRNVPFQLNGRAVAVEADPEMPLLWVLRERFGLTGAKYGCGVGVCGACTVHVGGAAVRACALPIGSVAGAVVTTIEGLAPPDGRTATQTAWLELQVPQCGYCQTGMIMAAEALLAASPRPTDAEIDAAVTNICRCGTHDRVRAAIHAAAEARAGA